MFSASQHVFGAFGRARPTLPPLAAAPPADGAVTMHHSRKFKGCVMYVVFRRNMADSEDQALLQQQYQAMRMDANGLASKISELEQGLAAFSMRIACILSTLTFRRSSRA